MVSDFNCPPVLMEHVAFMSSLPPMYLEVARVEKMVSLEKEDGISLYILLSLNALSLFSPGSASYLLFWSASLHPIAWAEDPSLSPSPFCG